MVGQCSEAVVAVQVIVYYSRLVVLAGSVDTLGDTRARLVYTVSSANSTCKR